MTTIKTIYLGELRTENEHLQSGNKVITDAQPIIAEKASIFRQPICWQQLWEVVS